MNLDYWSEVKWSESRSVVSDSLWHHGLYSPWNSPGRNTGVGSLSLFQGIFPTQVSNPDLLHCRRILYQLSHKGSPENIIMEVKRYCSIFIRHSVLLLESPVIYLSIINCVLICFTLGIFSFSVPLKKYLYLRFT